MRLAEFLHMDPGARANFFRHAAAHVWPRILRTVEEDLARLDADSRARSR